MKNEIICLVFIPLLMSIISGLFMQRVSVVLAQVCTCVGMAISSFLSLIIFYNVVIKGQSYATVELFRWIEINELIVNWALKIDSLTALMLVVVNIVSFLVHIYSVGYIHDGPHKPRFMSYLSLFTFFMLMLVTSDNFLQLFLGWEGVGLCSYLLIGFWYRKNSANLAAMKAFIVNRVGDFGFILGIFSIYLVFNSLQFDQVFKLVSEYSYKTFNILGYNISAIEITCMLLFIGCMGKSAQLGLHVWLPDAMEGPTPVSALIHAATMVTAGVFLLVRCSWLFQYAPVVLQIITIIGALTCIFAATIALTQNDIKKIIAYSTCSQLGYMFFACGVSAYNVAVFHLATHAFFKALLFLGAGSVIHAMSGEQDINKMGGIWRKIPFTYVMMWIGSLALAGIYPFAGYYSKDVIIESAYLAKTISGNFAYWMGVSAAFCTAFYSFRLLIKVFHGKFNGEQGVWRAIHESPLSMTVPLFILFIGAIFSGIIGEKLHIIENAHNFWHGSIELLHNHVHDIPILIKFMPVVVGVLGIVIAFIYYTVFKILPDITKSTFYPIYNLFYYKYYWDEIYEYIIVKPIRCLSVILWKKVDSLIIDGFGPNGVAKLVGLLSTKVTNAQTGYLYHYAYVMLFAVMVLVSWYILNIVN
ncbi:MAG: NADH-quinone oxidoreductase subunit L [Rickettsiales endosymbiont of Dermacentor nuttalli]